MNKEIKYTHAWVVTWKSHDIDTGKDKEYFSRRYNCTDDAAIICCLGTHLIRRPREPILDYSAFGVDCHGGPPPKRCLSPSETMKILKGEEVQP